MTSPIMPTPKLPEIKSISLLGAYVRYDPLPNEVYIGKHELDYEDVQLLIAFLTGIFPQMRAHRQEQLRTTPPYNYELKPDEEFQQLELNLWPTELG